MDKIENYKKQESFYQQHLVDKGYAHFLLLGVVGAALSYNISVGLNRTDSPLHVACSIGAAFLLVYYVVNDAKEQYTSIKLRQQYESNLRRDYNALSDEEKTIVPVPPSEQSKGWIEIVGQKIESKIKKFKMS